MGKQISKPAIAPMDGPAIAAQGPVNIQSKGNGSAQTLNGFHQGPNAQFDVLGRKKPCTIL